MTEIQKNNILLNCNTIPEISILEIIKSGDITLDEFISAGINPDKIDAIQNEMKAAIQSEKIELEKEEIKNQKSVHLDRILKGRISAAEINGLIISRAITFDDMIDAGLSVKTVNSLKHYCSTERIRPSFSIDELPPMEEGRTDVYFIGMAGSGKSTMLAGILKGAHMQGITLPDPQKNNKGATFQTNLIQDLNKGVLPFATEKGTYNYITLSLKDKNEKKHPFNIVDVPGENFKNIFENAEVDKLLKYINNNNKKILVFVIDSMTHESQYSDGQLDQSLVYPNILQMFNSNGVLDQTDAIYLVVNKFDALKDSRYSFDDRLNGDIAKDFLHEDFLGLINNCIDARKECRNEFKIKIVPYSIGEVKYEYLLNSFNKDFANTLTYLLLKDSFIVSGGVNKIF
jgi:GTP-binding protein EngB required for normal cell division